MPRRLICLLLLFPFLALSAQSTLLEAAQQTLSGNDTEAKVTMLDSLTTSGRTSPELYQALGNAHFARGATGRAILAYERGLRLRPGDAALTNNLAFVRQQAGIERLDLPDFFLARWVRGAGAALGATAFFWLALVFWVLAVAGGAAWYFYRQQMDEKRRFALLPAAAVFLGLAVLCYVIGDHRNDWLGNPDEVVLTARIADLRVAPGPDATLEKALTQGLKMRILDRRQGYVKVALDDGKQGWLPEETVEVI